MLSVACCVFYSHCGNHAQNESQFGQNDAGLFTLWETGERSELLAKFLKMYELNGEECGWFAPVSTRDYPIHSKWLIYAEVQVLFCST